MPARDHDGVVDMLMKLGADASLKNARGRTASEFALQAGNRSRASLLEKRGNEDTRSNTRGGMRDGRADARPLVDGRPMIASWAAEAREFFLKEERERAAAAPATRPQLRGLPLSVGARVVLVGLSRADLNGQLATVTELATRKDPERASVRLDATGQGIAIRRTNLRASPDEAQHPPLTVGARVVLVGTSSTALNGQLATVTEAAILNDPELVGVRLDTLATVTEATHVRLGTSDPGPLAICRTNLRVSPDSDDQTKSFAGGSLDEGHALAQRGDSRGALAKYEECLALGRTICDAGCAQEVIAAALNGLGNAYISLGQFEQAIDHHEQSLVIYHEIGNRTGEGNALASLGNASHSSGQVDKAVEHLEQALVIFRMIGDRQVEGSTLDSLGISYHDLKKFDKAIDRHTCSLVIYREIGDRQEEGRAQAYLGGAYFSSGQFDKAFEHHKQSLVIFRIVGDRKAEGHALTNLGVINRRLAQFDKAVEHHEQALAILREIGDQEGERQCLDSLERARKDIGRMVGGACPARHTRGSSVRVAKRDDGLA